MFSDHVFPGHYKLDLAELFDRKAAMCLVEINNVEQLFGRSESGRSDTSQTQNWANFRNATYRGKSLQLEAGFFHSVGLLVKYSLTLRDSLLVFQTPKSGVLEFDYVSTTRAPIGTMPMKKYEFDEVMKHIDLTPPRRLPSHTTAARGRAADPHFAVFQQLRVAMCDRWLSTEQVPLAGLVAHVMISFLADHRYIETIR
jgi:hypothetical protein